MPAGRDHGLRRVLKRFGILSLAATCALQFGCGRPYWRQNADAEAYGLIREKARLDARWVPPRSDIIPSPHSRLFDPADPDFGPLPPDDPAAHQYMHHMSDCGRIHGDNYYNKIGRTNFIENPVWVASLPVGDSGVPIGVMTAGGPQPTPADPSATRPGTATVGRAVVGGPGRGTAGEGGKEPQTAAAQAGGAVGQSLFAQRISIKPVTPAAGTATVGSASAHAVPNGNAVKRDSAIQTVAYQVEESILPAPPTNLPLLDQPSQNADEPNGNSLVPTPPVTDADADRELSPQLAEDETPSSAPKGVAGPNIAAANPALPPVEDLTLPDAIALSYLHSREYQTQLENVYLAALALAYDRFQFDVRFLGLTGPPRASLDYESVPGVRDGLGLNTRFGIRRLLPAGGQYAVELLNNTLWLFSDAPNESGTASVLSFSLVQPLLLGAGRKVVLEGLTQSERNLLYALRDLARFRQEFFVQTVSAGPSGGYLGLLQQTQSVANLEDNIRRLEEQLDIVRASQGDALSEAQLESRLLSSLQQLRESRRSLQDRLDQFKIQLGLPPDLPVTLDTTLLRPFQLIGPELKEIEALASDEFLRIFRATSNVDPTMEQLSQLVGVLETLIERIETDGFGNVEADFEKVRANRTRRLAALSDPADIERVKQNALRDRDAYLRSREEFRKILRNFAAIQQTFQGAQSLEDRVLVYRQSKELQEELLQLGQGLQGIEIGLRTELIELNPFEMPIDLAVGYALTNRVDLMNERALVVDARRKVEVAANSLRAVLNVRVEGDVATPPLLQNDNPFDFRGRNSSYRAGLEFVPPLDRVLQRNDYRATQIQYQRQRRLYMAFEDQVKYQVRNAWRALEVQRQNFETARVAIRIAALQYDQAIERANAPAGTSGGGGGGGGSSGSSQGLNLIQALNSVLSAQNSLIGIWVDYESVRLNIYRDMGLMEIDARGLWCDPFYQDGGLGDQMELTRNANPPALERDGESGPSLLPVDPESDTWPESDPLTDPVPPNPLPLKQEDGSAESRSPNAPRTLPGLPATPDDRPGSVDPFAPAEPSDPTGPVNPMVPRASSPTEPPAAPGGGNAKTQSHTRSATAFLPSVDQPVSSAPEGKVPRGPSPKSLAPEFSPPTAAEPALAGESATNPGKMTINSNLSGPTPPSGGFDPERLSPSAHPHGAQTVDRSTAHPMVGKSIPPQEVGSIHVPASHQQSSPATGATVSPIPTSEKRAADGNATDSGTARPQKVWRSIKK